MFEKIKEQRRIYKLVKNIKHKLEDTPILFEKHDYFSTYKFNYNNINIALTISRMIGDIYFKYVYSVYVNDCQITGWYGLKLEWMLRRIIYKRGQQEDLNQLKSIGIKDK